VFSRDWPASEDSRLEILGLRDSVCARLAGLIAVSVTEVMVANLKLQTGVLDGHRTALRL
jgi:hypothetical protein